MKKIFLLCVLPILALTLFTGCEGDEGPQGPQGEQGEQGIQGTQGIQGIQGETGTANVIYSTWSTALDGVWRDSTILGASIKVNHLKVPDLTQDILDEGVILCYSRYLGTISPLPYTVFSGGVAVTTDFRPYLNKLLFYNYKHDASGGLALSPSVYWRYILIPGGVAATAKKSTVDLTKLSYEEICLIYNIPQ